MKWKKIPIGNFRVACWLWKIIIIKMSLISMKKNFQIKSRFYHNNGFATWRHFFAQRQRGTRKYRHVLHCNFGSANGRWPLLRGWTILDQNFDSWRDGNCRGIPVKSQFREKIQYFPLRNFRLFHYPEITGYVTTPYQPISALLSVKWFLTWGWKQYKISDS